MGSLYRQQYHFTDAKGVKHKRFVKKWYIQFKDKDGNWKREPAYEDKEASLHKLSRRMKEVALECEGIFTHLTAELKKPISEHLTDFVQHLRDKRNTHDYCVSAETRLKNLFSHGKIERIPDITKSRVDSALSRLRDPAIVSRPLSTKTSNSYLTFVKQFATWLVDERRAGDNLISGMRKRSEEGEQTMERRPLSPVEFGRVLDAARTGEPWKGKGRKPIAGADRMALYLLASFTGYRRRELSSITPSAFDFGDNPTLKVHRGFSKRRRMETIPLNREIAAFFKRYVARKPKDEPLWNIAGERTALMIQSDMRVAGLPHTKGIVVVDFHSLRQTFTTGLARAGVAPKVAQQLARHSDVNLTMKLYTKMNSDDERAAVESLPVPSALVQPLVQDSARRRKNAPRHKAEKRGLEVTESPRKPERKSPK